MMGYYYYYYYDEMEKIVKEILEHAGYAVTDASPNSNRPMLDLIMRKDGKGAYVVVKGSESKRANTSMILSTVNELVKWWMIHKEANFVPMLIFVGIVGETIKKRIRDNELTRDVEIWDVRDLLGLAQDDSKLKNRFVALLPFSIDEYLSDTDETQILEQMIHKLESWVSPIDKGKTYEKLCVSVLEKLFYDDLTKWSPQQQTDGGLFRFDLICKIKNEHNRDFWSMAERFFQTKYIVFEFKDYQEPITQREVYTTVKYLYPKALRGIAILISAKGIDKHGEKAIQGILRDEGKLIIVLDNSDLIKMLKLKKQHSVPADYLSAKLDELLINLEK